MNRRAIANSLRAKCARAAGRNKALTVPRQMGEAAARLLENDPVVHLTNLGEEVSKVLESQRVSAECVQQVEQVVRRRIDYAQGLE